jgi:hypothetical protein
MLYVSLAVRRDRKIRSKNGTPVFILTGKPICGDQNPGMLKDRTDGGEG